MHKRQNSRIRLWIFLLFPFHLLANPIDPSVCAGLETDPIALVEGAVNVLTGDYVLQTEELFVPGEEPLSLKGTYLSGDGKGELGGWTLTPHCNLLIWARKNKKEKEIVTTYLPNGTCLEFSEDGKGQYTLIPPIGAANTARGPISSRSNLHNTALSPSKDLQFTLFAPDGTKRHYRRKYANSQLQFYTLDTEELPNGNRINYEYDTEYRPLSIATLGPDSSEPFASCTFSYEGKKGKNEDFTVTTSDGQTVKFAFIKRKRDRKDRLFFLSEITGEEANGRKYVYVPAKEPVEERIAGFRTSSGASQMVDYYPPQDFAKVEGGRVRALKGPFGPGGAEITTHQFSYQMKRDLEKGVFSYSSGGSTTVQRSDKSRVEYYFSSSFLLEKVVYRTPSGAVDHSITMRWSKKGELEEKAIWDEKGGLLSKRTFQYDWKGNPIKEIFEGDLTGTGEWEKEVTERGYDREGRLVHQTGSNSARITCTYHQGTDRLSSLFLWSGDLLYKRQFFSYDANLLLNRVIIDDGTGENSEDVTDVTFRKILLYEGGTYRPLAIEEWYWDSETATEQLLKKELFTYTGARVRVISFDADGVEIRAREFEQDRKGKPLVETDEYGVEIHYSYDSFGKLLCKKSEGKPEERFSYDLAGRLLSRSLGDAVTQLTYAPSQIKVTDPLGNETLQLFDSEGRLSEERFPSLLGPGEKVVPVIWKYLYRGGNCTEKIDPDGGSYRYLYNCRGQIVEERDPKGNITKRRFFPNGALRSIQEPDGTLTVIQRDILGRTVRKEVFSSDGSPLSAEECRYSPFFLLEKRVKNETVYSARYNWSGQKIEERRGDLVTLFTYNSKGLVQGEVTGSSQTLFTYDSSNRVIEKRTSEGVEKFAYSLMGHLSKVEKEGEVLEYLYGDEGELQEIFFPNKETANLYKEVSIDPEAGWRGVKKRVEFSSGLAYEELYDPLGRCILRKEGEESTSYTFTPGGKIHKIESGPSTLFFSDTGLPIEKTGKEGSTTCSYTEKGLPKLLTLPNKIEIRYRYDAEDRLIEMASSDETIHYTLRYDSLGRLTQIRDEISGRCGNRAYDRLGSIVEETFLNGKTLKNQYDREGHRVSLTLPDETKIFYRWREDSLIEIVRQMNDDLFEYRHKLQHYNMKGFPTAQRLPGQFGELYFLEDRQGNPLTWNSRAEGPLKEQKLQHLGSLPSILPYELFADSLGRIIQVKFPDKEIFYTYDIFHRRLSKIVTSQTPVGWKITHHLSYLYDGMKEIGAYDETEKWIKELKVLSDVPCNFGDGAVGYELDNLPYVPLLNREGSVHKLLSLSRGKLMEKYNYTESGQEQIEDIWGITLSDSKAGNPWRYKGLRLDPETRLYYMNGRYYSPEKGAFVTPPLNPIEIDEVKPLSLPLPKIFGKEQEPFTPEEGLTLFYPSSQ